MGNCCCLCCRDLLSSWKRPGNKKRNTNMSSKNRGYEPVSQTNITGNINEELLADQVGMVIGEEEITAERANSAEVQAAHGAVNRINTEQDETAQSTATGYNNNETGGREVTIAAGTVVQQSEVTTIESEGAVNVGRTDNAIIKTGDESQVHVHAQQVIFQALEQKGTMKENNVSNVKVGLSNDGFLVKIAREDGSNDPVMVRMVNQEDGKVEGQETLPPENNTCTFVTPHFDKTYKMEATTIVPDSVGSWVTSTPIKLYDLVKNNSEELMGFIKFKSTDGVKKILKDLFYNEKKPLREGYEVYEGMMGGANPQVVAVKLISKAHVWKREVINKVDHQNVIKYLWDGEFNSYYVIAMEMCESTLDDLAKNEGLDLDFRKKAMIQLFYGLSHIHARDILHRDLKPGNVLKCQENIKIADFGLSKRKREGKSKWSKSDKEVGTDGWGSPESFKQKAEHMTKSSDIYSAGLVFFYFMSKGIHPFGEEEEHWKSNIMRNEYRNLQVLPQNTPYRELIIDLTEKMIATKPEDRPTADEVLKHPFFWKDERKLEFMCDINDHRSLGVMGGLDGEVKDLGKEGWLGVLKVSDEEGGGPVYKEAKNPTKTKKKYKSNAIQSLFEFIRNLRHHLDEKPDIKGHYGTRAELWKFFASRPFIAKLFLKAYDLVGKKYHEKKNKGKEEAGEIPGEFHKYFTEKVENVELPLVSA